MFEEEREKLETIIDTHIDMLEFYKKMGCSDDNEVIVREAVVLFKYIPEYIGEHKNIKAEHYKNKLDEVMVLTGYKSIIAASKKIDTIFKNKSMHDL